MESITSKHADLVEALVKPGKDLLKGLTPESANLLHAAVGIAGEAGELLDAIKKHAVYEKTLDLQNVIEELGDLEFYMQQLRSALDIDRDQTLVDNILKLEVRYEKGKFSNSQAQERADKK